MEKISEYKCRDCGHEYEAEIDFGCPKCGGLSKRLSTRMVCECGKTVYLDGFTNECECGRLYNPFGQKLADPSTWDEEDRYACFGPQN